MIKILEERKEECFNVMKIKTIINILICLICFTKEYKSTSDCTPHISNDPSLHY